MAYVNKNNLRTIVKKLKTTYLSREEATPRIEASINMLTEVNYDSTLKFDTEWIIGEGAGAYVGVAIVGVTHLS